MQNSVLAQMCCQFCVADPRDKKSRYSYSKGGTYSMRMSEQLQESILANCVKCYTRNH